MLISTGQVRPDSIAGELRARVIAQTITPGAAVTEAAVALEFGVARATARTAIDRLVKDGLLRRGAHRAARVPELDRDEVIDLYDSRAVIESAAVTRLAADGLVPATALAAHREIAGAAEFAQHDIAFHRALVVGASGARLARMHEVLMGEVELCIGRVQAAELMTSAEVAAQHQGIIDAILAGRAEDAVRLTRQHIATARDALLTHLGTR